MGKGPLPRELARRVSLLLALVAAGCTPIREPAKSAGAQMGSAGRGRAAGEAGSVGGAGGMSAAPAAPNAAADAPCAVEGERSCDRDDPRGMLACEALIWKTQTPCKENERCDPAPGPLQGRCRAPAQACGSRAPGQRFCEGDARMVCKDPFEVVADPCSPQQHCVAPSGEALCECLPGTIPQGTGCREATDCDRQNGGCDMLTTCMMQSGKRVCTECPPGYAGSGLDGCRPLLLALQPSTGALMPAFAEQTFEYRVEVGLLVQQLELETMLPQRARIDWNGVAIEHSLRWSSDVLALGDNPVNITLTSESGVSTTYKLVVARSGREEAYVKSSNTGVDDRFGFGLALSGATLLTAAPYEDGAAAGVNGDQGSNTAQNSGAGYVFVRDGAGWKQEAYLKSDAPADDDYLGAGLAIDGDTIVLGAPRADPLASGASVSASVSVPMAMPTKAGAIWVFTRRDGAWALQSRLAPAEGSVGDLFGASAALQGNRMVVGAPWESSGQTRSGAVYVYERTGSTWREVQRLKPSEPHAEAMFGNAVALDGDTIAIGARRDSTAARSGGSAYVFVLQNGSWVEQQRLGQPTPSETATFGFSVAVFGDTLAVGAPRADLFVTTGRGEVYLFDRAGGVWTQSQVLMAPVSRNSDYFGASVALADRTLLVGGNGDASSARTLDGDAADSGAPYSGAAYLFTRKDDTWAQSTYLKASNAEGDDAFGHFVALSGETAAVSAPYERSAATGIGAASASNAAMRAGAVYLFR
jgi:trimeric autotransporter adhesin